MAKDESGTRWAQWPVAGAVGAGRSDELALPPDSFGLTPSGAAEQAAQAAEIPAELLGQEVPGAGSEQPG